MTNASMNSDSSGRLSSQAGQGAGHGVLELAGQDVGVAGPPRVAPQVLGQHLGHGQLVDVAVPRADHVLLPQAPVTAGLEQ